MNIVITLHYKMTCEITTINFKVTLDILINHHILSSKVHESPQWILKTHYGTIMNMYIYVYIILKNEWWNKTSGNDVVNKYNIVSDDDL